MTTRTRSMAPLVLALGAVLVLGTPSWAAKKGLKISVEDDPSMKEGAPGLVLVEIGELLPPEPAAGPE